MKGIDIAILSTHSEWWDRQPAQEQQRRRFLYRDFLLLYDRRRALREWHCSRCKGGARLFDRTWLLFGRRLCRGRGTRRSETGPHFPSTGRRT